MEYLFVYGTLRSNSNSAAHQHLKAYAQFESMARCQGEIYDLGEYPGFRPDREADRRVIGELYAINDPETIFALLDPYEGYEPSDVWHNEFVRETIMVERENGESVLAWIYTYNQRVKPEQRIASGDYLAHIGQPDQKQ